MLNFNVDILPPSILENSSSALVVSADQVIIAYRNMMEDKVDTAYHFLAKDPCFNAANRLRNIGRYQSEVKNLLHSAMVWMAIRAQSDISYSRMLKERQAYLLIEDAHIDAYGYKIIFMIDKDIMKAQILDTDGDELCSVSARM